MSTRSVTEMEGYEFMAAIQRLSLIASMMEKTDVEAVLSHLGYVDAVAPMFGLEPSGSARLMSLRRFVSKAAEFKTVCQEYRDRLSEAQELAGQTRRDRALLAAPDAAPPPESPC